MASPFNIFRKRQRALLVIVGVLCIFVFTVGDVMLQWFGPDTGIGREVQTVVTWKGGSLDEDELAALRGQHLLTIAYLDQVVDETIKRDGTPKRAGQSLQTQRGQIVNPGIARDASDERLVQNLLLAEEAEKLGMEVPDAAILEFLFDLSDRTLSSDELRNLLHGATRGRLTRDQLFNNIRRELLAQKYFQLAAAGEVMTPEDAWSYYLRLYRRIDASLVEFEAEDYLDQAPQPTREQVRELYEKHKDDFSTPGSPEPGFKQRAEYRFAYFKADYDKFMEEAKAKISATEVEKHYEENKERYQVPDLPELPDAKADPESTDEAPGASPGESPAESPDAPAKETSDEEAADALPDDAPPPEDSSARESTSAEFPVVFQPGAADAPAVEEEGSDVDLGAPANAKEASQPPAEDANAAPKTDAPPSEEPKIEDSEADVQYQPLAEVEDDIRRTLAAETVREQIDAALREAERTVDRYGRGYRRHLGAQKQGARSKPPERPNFQEIAEKSGLIYEQTPPVNVLTVGETELGQTVQWPSQESMAMGNFQLIPFAQLAMQNEDSLLYQPKVIPNRIVAGQNVYLYWPTEIRPSYTPELEEVRDEVVRAWRLEQALEIARREAQAAAEKLRKAGGDHPLHEVLRLDEAEVIQPPEFTWMTAQGRSLPFGGGQPRISDVEGVENPGDEFFRTAYSLEPGEVGVAPNASKTAVYLIRVEDATPPEEIRKHFLTGMQFDQDVRYVAQLEQQQKIFQWLEDLEKAWGLEWRRPPDRGGA